MYKDNQPRFDSIEQAQVEEIEVRAELLKQKEILRNELELENKKHMDAIMQNMSKSQMYQLGVNDQVQPMQQAQPMQPERHSCIRDSFVKGKDRIIAALLVVIIILLAVGITPSGAWYETIQTSWVETLVDVFKVSMIGFGVYLTVKLFKK